jgi:hypothetical protein
MKEKRYYIAYGSNLSVEQMAYRCPDAKIVGTAELHGWQLMFKGVATIEPKPEKNTPVLVWEISRRDEANLDRYEGFPNFYFKKELPVEVVPQGGGAAINLLAMVYIMTDGYPVRAPSDYYYDVLKKGYKTFGFPMEILQQALADSKEAVK